MTEETTQAPEITEEVPEVIDYSEQLYEIHSEVQEVNSYLCQIDYNTKLDNTIGLFNIALLVGVGVTLLLSRVFKRFF